MATRRQRAKKTNIWDVLTAITLIATIIAVLYAVYIYINPISPLNPYPPKPLVSDIAEVNQTALATEIPTDVPTLPPTWTTEPTSTTTVTRTPHPMTATATPLIIVSATSTPYLDIIEITPIPEHTDPASLFFTPTATLRINYLYRYVLQSEPYTIPASSTDPNKTCEWMGVAGQVFDIQGRPATGINVNFGGAGNNSG